MENGGFLRTEHKGASGKLTLQLPGRHGWVRPVGAVASERVEASGTGMVPWVTAVRAVLASQAVQSLSPCALSLSNADTLIPWGGRSP